MFFFKIAILMVLSLAHDLYPDSISKEIIEHELCTRSSFVLDAACYGHDP